MAGVQQIESQLVEGEGELHCRSCGVRNLKHSVFCSACGYYLRKRAEIAVLLVMTSALGIAALLILVFKEEWFWELLSGILIGASVLRWILLAIFGFRGQRYEERKTLRRKKKELAEQPP